MMQQSPGRPAGMTFETWDRGPFNRWSFQHVRELVPTACVERGDAPGTPLERALQDFSGLPFSLDGAPSTIGAWLDSSQTDGFMVIHRGRILAEDYRNGMGPRTPHLVQSVSKSVTSAAAGALVEAGLLDPDAPVTDYLPELSATAYAGARLRHVLDMTSGVFFDETYTAADSHCAWLDAAAGWKPAGGTHWPRTVHDLILRLDQAETTHGASFRYRSIETDVLAMAMERASGLPLAALVSRHVWAPMGAEDDACFTVDPSGYAAADGGFNATLRDLGRFGLLMARNGALGGRQIVPEAWMRDCLAGDASLFRGAYRAVLPDGAYRNQFWLEAPGKRILICRGVFGQVIYIDMDADFVAVKLSTWPDFIDVTATRTALAAIRAIRDAL